MNRKIWTVGLLAVLTQLMPSNVHAHLRNFLDTYGYDTLKKNHSEMEIHTDLNDPDDGDRYWYNQTEVEYGWTDRYTMGIYGVFIDGKGFSALKIENRYRLAEKGQWPVDTALYFEIKDANDHKDQDEFEAKVILEKNIDKWNIAVNPIIEWEREIKANGDTEWEAESGLAAGVAYKLGGVVTPGVEVFFAENKSRITPGLYIDILPEVRFNIGVGLGLESKADDAQIKTILEIEF